MILGYHGFCLAMVLRRIWR